MVLTRGPYKGYALTKQWLCKTGSVMHGLADSGMGLLLVKFVSPRLSLHLL